MRIVWNEQTVRWFRNASAYTGYNRKLAQLLLAHIPCRETLCDVGCGLGLIDLELSPYIGQITCVDISAGVISALEQSIRQRGIANVTPVCADALSLQGQWDTAIALFFGGYTLLPAYLSRVQDRLILAVHEESKGRFGPADHKAIKCTDVQNVKAFLDAQGIHYHLEIGALEYGQPFPDRQDAEAFVRAYSTPMRQDELDAYLSAHLQQTGQEDFPFYLPKEKKFGLFVIRRDENENFG